MPRLLGITGNIATGKTTIGRMLLELGAARYIDADAIVHDLYRPGESIYEAVVQSFDPQILTPEGEIDRKALGEIVFHDGEQLRRLEAITHPAVTAAVAAQIMAAPSDAVVVIDAVKLLEGGTGKLCEAVWLIVCDLNEERRRLIADRGMSVAEADARLAAQPDNDARRPLVSEIIDNSGDISATRLQVQSAWERFLARQQN
ncbi:MAG TPA: dephospho-CoA kinase [Ktedonobacterales bacterium]|nr:dephospho-CoA kinase [Ktedonobacterales bacterium]